MNTRNWYAVYTRPKWEKKVAELFVKKKIENYCPLNRVTRQWSDRRKMVMEPLFTSYVFVRTMPGELNSVLETDGVINMVYWLRRPAIIRDVEINVIRQFLGEHENVQLEKTAVDLNDMVRVTSGPLMLREGSIIEVMHKTVKVILPSLGYRLVAEVSKSNIEKIPAFSHDAQAFHYQ